MSINSGSINSFEINGIINSGGNTVFPAVFVPRKIVFNTAISVLFSGSQDGQQDIIIPVSSINGSITSSGTNSIVVVIRDAKTYSEELSKRPNALFTISSTEFYSDGTSKITQSNQYSLQSAQNDRGAENWSISVRGVSVTPLRTTFNKFNAEGIRIQSVGVDGKTRIRLNYNPELVPGDTIIDNDDNEIIINSITYTINSQSNTFFMTIKE